MQKVSSRKQSTEAHLRMCKRRMSVYYVCSSFKWVRRISNSCCSIPYVDDVRNRQGMDFHSCFQPYVSCCLPFAWTRYRHSDSHSKVTTRLWAPRSKLRTRAPCSRYYRLAASQKAHLSIRLPPMTIEQRWGRRGTGKDAKCRRLKKAQGWLFSDADTLHLFLCLADLIFVLSSLAEVGSTGVLFETQQAGSNDYLRYRAVL